LQARFAPGQAMPLTTRPGKCGLRLLGCILSLLLLIALPAKSQSLNELVNLLGEADPAQRRALALRIARVGDQQSEAVLRALGRGALFLDRRNGRVVLAQRDGSRYRLSDPFDGSTLGDAGRRDVRRIATDNALRAELGSLLAIGHLEAADPQIRRAAIAEILAAPTPLALSALAERQIRESDSTLREEIAVGLALQTLNSGEVEGLEAALDALAGRTEGAVRAALLALSQREGLEPTMQNRAAKLLARAQNRLSWLARLESLFFGLSLGSVLLLSAIGLAITFGVMGVINMAHGELIMLGAYTTWLLQQWLPNHLGMALLLAVPAAFMVSATVGLLIERGVIRFLYGRPLETLLATFGVSLVLQQTVRSLFSPLNRAVITPEWLSGSLELMPGLALTYNRLAILIFSLLVFLSLLALMRGTRLGLQVRAVAQNRAMARALGVRSARVDALTFALGSGVAGVAGVALSQLTNVGPNLGQAYIIDSFLVVVFGGVGNLWGTLVAAFSLGVANKLLEPAVGAVLAKILLLLALIVFLQRRPQGLFPRLGRQDSN
jgi:urea transport system permease protein